MRTILLSILTIVAIDSVSYIFREKLAIILPNYGVAIEDFSRGYPIGHFQKDTEIGFDITPNFRTATHTKPLEYEKYEVWGNSHGCFDDEWGKDTIIGGIYLAGDSFTWGYTKYDKKFGTLLEETLGTKVYACGVTHTGQGHQFYKFKRLHVNGLKPSVVIVNIFANDLDDDLFFPRTTVVDGVMVEDVESCGDFRSADFKYKKLTYEEVVSLVEEKRNENPSLRNLLRQYSLTANVIAEITRGVRNRLTERNQEKNREIQKLSCQRSPHAGLSAIGSLYPTSKFTKKNRGFISDWIIHAKSNGYHLIFSFIPAKNTSENFSYKYIKKYIEANNGIAFRFDDFCDRRCREENDIYFNFNGHFNESGNKIYADFLQHLIENLFHDQ